MKSEPVERVGRMTRYALKNATTFFNCYQDTQNA